MTTSGLNPKLDAFFNKAKTWREESKQLRRIILGCPLKEELKWRQPCYTFQGKNIVLIGRFKEYCALLFYKGALLRDPHGLLAQPGEHTQLGRLIRFTNVRQIAEMESILKAYIGEAIEAETSGLKVKLKSTAEFSVPEELTLKLTEDPALKKAFAALTPGRQRGYLLYFSAPKQSKTREARIEKCRQRILEGKGFYDE
jgi:uncharacterized protein YdeI (YjbR/CyaY-like superfamily)